jgi:tetratricopeptide (TPR) repeat protein
LSPHAYDEKALTTFRQTRTVLRFCQRCLQFRESCRQFDQRDAWRSKGEYARAIADYTQVVQLNPTYAPAFNNRAVSRVQIGELKNALADFNEAIRIDPTFAPAYRDRGAYWARAGKNAEAIVDFDEAIRCDPTDPMAHFNRGTYWTHQKRFEKAIVDLSEAIRLNPRLEQAYGNLAWLQATCADTSYRNGHEAVRLAQRACELTGWSDAAHLDTLAAAYAELGDFPNAVKWQKKAIEIDADDNMRTRLSLYEAGEPFYATPQE